MCKGKNNSQSTNCSVTLVHGSIQSNRRATFRRKNGTLLEETCWRARLRMYPPQHVWGVEVCQREENRLENFRPNDPCCGKEERLNTELMTVITACYRKESEEASPSHHGMSPKHNLIRCLHILWKPELHIQLDCCLNDLGQSCGSSAVWFIVRSNFIRSYNQKVDPSLTSLV